MVALNALDVNLNLRKRLCFPQFLDRIADLLSRNFHGFVLIQTGKPEDLCRAVLFYTIYHDVFQDEGPGFVLRVYRIVVLWCLRGSGLAIEMCRSHKHDDG